MHLMSHTLMKESIAHEARRLGSVKDQPTSLFEWKQSELKHTHTHTHYVHTCMHVLYEGVLYTLIRVYAWGERGDLQCIYLTGLEWALKLWTSVFLSATTFHISSFCWLCRREGGREGGRERECSGHGAMKSTCSYRDHNSYSSPV